MSKEVRTTIRIPADVQEDLTQISAQETERCFREVSRVQVVRTALRFFIKEWKGGRIEVYPGPPRGGGVFHPPRGNSES